MSPFRLTLGLLAALVLVEPSVAAEVRGRIARVEIDKNQLQLEARPLKRGLPVTIKVDARTQVLFGKQVAALADVPVGRLVRIIYEERDGQPTASVIHVVGRPLRPVAPPAATAGETVTGELRRVAYTEREVVVVGPGAKGPMTETIVLVPEKTRVTRDGKVIAFDALREGEQAVVSVERRGERWSAKAIQIGAPAPAEKTASEIVPRVRQALKIADFLLKQMERGRE